MVRKNKIPHVRFHDLRYSHATLERLGHSTITIAMDTDSHVMPIMQKEATSKLDDFLFGQGG
ncbi:hypothetical protein [Thermoactinomyces sp. DSM 45892]|uniref:hypothetical protein n=1 Tax=Thermoactinomyces sp. DSM 45892 TaxID=1882753 RepID=UPI000B818F08|nr:hypothetical protein [Thermoactinomyces sp. DSM 45892]